MNKIIYTLLLGISLTSITANAISIRGDNGCGNWVKERSEGRDFQSIWLLGYMNGLAVGTIQDILKNTDAEQIFLWMDNYCKNNPLEKVYWGGQILFSELKKRKDLK